MSKKPKHPMQPLVRDRDGTIRFKENRIVRVFLDWANQRGMDLNTIACMEFSQEDREQFAQLIGYSVSGFGELSYVRRKTIAEADRMAEEFLTGKEPTNGSDTEG